MATFSLSDIFATSSTEKPEEVIAKYKERLEAVIEELENDIQVTKKQLIAAKASLEALEKLK